MEYCVRNTFPYEQKTFQCSDTLCQQLCDIIMHKLENSQNFEINGGWDIEMAQGICDCLNNSSLFTNYTKYTSQTIASCFSLSGSELDEYIYNVQLTAEEKQKIDALGERKSFIKVSSVSN